MCKYTQREATGGWRDKWKGGWVDEAEKAGKRGSLTRRGGRNFNITAQQLVRNTYSQKKNPTNTSLSLWKESNMINQEIQRGTAVAWESEETESQLTTASLLSIDAWFESGFILRGNGAKLLEIIQCSTKWYFNFVPQSVYSVKEHRWSGERNLLWSLSWLAVPNTACFTALWANIDTFCRWCVIVPSPVRVIQHSVIAF